MNRRTFGLAVAGWLALPRAARAQEGPDHRGEVVTDEPVYRGKTANAAIPGPQHFKNEPGSDGAGLCVYASNTIDGVFQDVPELRDGRDSRLWRYVKGRPGGSYPEKFQRDLEAVEFRTKWLQFEGTSDEALSIIRHYNEQGLPVAVTMNTGALYGYRPIHHMVSLVHIDDDDACIVDNNDPGKYHWMPRDEFARRFMDGPKGWFVVILYGGRKGLPIPGAKTAGGALLLAAAARLLLRGRRG